MGELSLLLESILSRYAKKGFNGYTELTSNPQKTWFVVTSVGNTRSEGRVISTALAVHLVGTSIVIETDNTNKPLVDALLDSGVARSQIILAYRGEPVPEEV